MKKQQQQQQYLLKFLCNSPNNQRWPRHDRHRSQRMTFVIIFDSYFDLRFFNFIWLFYALLAPVTFCCRGHLQCQQTKQIAACSAALFGKAYRWCCCCSSCYCLGCCCSDCFGYCSYCCCYCSCCCSCSCYCSGCFCSSCCCYCSCCCCCCV